MGKVYVVGTCDTKGEELKYLRACVRDTGLPAVLIDVSTRNNVPAPDGADVAAAEIASHHPAGAAAIYAAKERGEALTEMARALTNYLTTRDDVAGVVGIGGSGNTGVVTTAMQALPVGVPKLMVSTVAAGNVTGYVGATDICLMYSVVDIAGLNAISRTVIGNAAAAIAGMARRAPDTHDDGKPSIGITMFGVTTACVDQIRQRIEGDYECFVFHATGTGGRSVEKLVDSGLISGVIDITTTEVADHLFGGVFPCTDDRFGAIARTKVPYVASCGALDMVNFDAMDTVPERFRDRKLYVHSPQVTLMRTTPEENQAMGAWIAARLNRCEGPVRFLIPDKGVSALDAEGMAFHDPEADAALFSVIERDFRQTADRQLIHTGLHINDPRFARLAADTFTSLTAQSRTGE